MVYTLFNFVYRFLTLVLKLNYFVSVNFLPQCNLIYLQFLFTLSNLCLHLAFDVS